jgi:hypothetical protein
MSNLARGEVAVTLAGTPRTLKPSLNAFSQLGARYDNYGVLMAKIATGNVPAIVMVLRVGLGLNDAGAKELPALVMKTGVTTLIDPLTDYVFRLFNNGKTAEEVQAESSGDDLAPVEGGGEAASGEEANPLLAG